MVSTGKQTAYRGTEEGPEWLKLNLAMQKNLLKKKGGEQQWCYL
jgi:hypothetical protein